MTRPMTPPENAPVNPRAVANDTAGEPPPRHVVSRALTGVVLAIIGSLTLLGLIWISNSDDAALERLMFDLGLGLTSLISASAQALVFFGLWLLWTAVRRPR